MCFLLVLIFHLVCFPILSLCTAPKKICDYEKYREPQLWMKVTVQNVTTCISLKSGTKTITFRQQDTMILFCQRIAGNGTWDTLRESAQLQWKLKQFNQKLMITEGISIYKNVIGSNTTTLNLDRYDDDLIVICASNGSEQNNTIHVQFKYNAEENDTDINEDIKIVNITEGQMMRNEFANSVILYNAPDKNRDPKAILPNDIIFNSITLEDNGTMYASWAEKCIDLQKKQTIIVKTKWVVYVEPANSGAHFLFILGIGGISCIVIAIIIAVCCKYCRNKNENSIENTYAEVYEVASVQANQYQVNNPNPRPEEGDYAQIPSQNDRVVYAEIDIRKADKSTPMQNNEPYAKIIGVVRPNKNGQNLKMF